MPLRNDLYIFVVWILYPLWLIGGAIDYFCHRRTNIEHTAGVRESALHILEYVCIAVSVVLSARYFMSGAILWIVASAMIVHTALSYVDVAYTVKRRYISPLEQHVHALMVVVPPIAVALLALADRAGSNDMSMMRSPALSASEWGLVFGSLIAGGASVAEEFVRTFAARGKVVPASNAISP